MTESPTSAGPHARCRLCAAAAAPDLCGSSVGFQEGEKVRGCPGHEHAHVGTPHDRPVRGARCTSRADSGVTRYLSTKPCAAMFHVESRKCHRQHPRKQADLYVGRSPAGEARLAETLGFCSPPQQRDARIQSPTRVACPACQKVSFLSAR